MYRGDSLRERYLKDAMLVQATADKSTTQDKRHSEDLVAHGHQSGDPSGELFFDEIPFVPFEIHTQNTSYTDSTDSSETHDFYQWEIDKLKKENQVLLTRVEDYQRLVGKLLHYDTKNLASLRSPKWHIQRAVLAQNFRRIFGRAPLLKRKVVKSSLESLCPQCKLIIEFYDPRAVGTTQSVDSLEAWTTLIWETNKLLEDTAQAGCALCLLFFQILSKKEVTSMRKHKVNALKDQTTSRPFLTQYWCAIYLEQGVEESDEIPLGLLMTHRLDERTEISVEAKFAEIPKTEIAGTNLMAIGNSTFTSTSAKQARIWINECLQFHSSCEVPRRRFFPSRIIDIGDGKSIIPRLRLRSEIPPRSHYFTLSHCWGVQVPLRLLQRTFGDMRKHIHFRSLSKTFQDALLVTKRLGGRYIWIDSLCIIQDSPDDWDKESSEMGEIYSYGLCNIAAAAAFNGSDGLFFNRNPITIPPIRTQLPTNKTPESDFLLIDDNLWGKEMGSSPLLRRAWVCQEQWLSPRTLHFGCTQLYWKCRTHGCCESYPAGMPKSIRQQWAKKSILNSSENGLVLWAEVVESYAGCSLTYETDKLVAISGLAALISGRIKSPYCAGLWRDSLANQLLWRTSKFRNLLSRYGTYIAPTWSWASIKGPISHLTTQIQLAQTSSTTVLVDIIEVKVELAGQNPFGHVQGGFLCLQGRIAKVLALPHNSGDSSNGYAGSSNTTDSVANIDMVPDIKDPNHSNDYLAPVVLPSEPMSPHNSVDLPEERSFYNVIGDYVIKNPRNGDIVPIFLNQDIPMRARQQNKPIENLFLLPITFTDSHDSAGKTKVEGLALKTTGVKDDEFVRWGQFHAYEAKGIRDLERFCSMFDETAEESGLKYYNDNDKGMRYTITII